MLTGAGQASNSVPNVAEVDLHVRLVSPCLLKGLYNVVYINPPRNTSITVDYEEGRTRLQYGTTERVESVTFCLPSLRFRKILLRSTIYDGSLT